MLASLRRVFLFVGVSLAIAGCSKDQDSPKGGAPMLFNHRLQVVQGEDFSVAKGEAIPTGIASDTDKALWVSGNILPPPVAENGEVATERAIVRQSQSYGDKNSWAITSDSNGPTHEGAHNAAIASDARGNVYVAQTYKSGKNSTASILYSTDGGLNWKNADYVTPNLSSSLNSVTMSPNGVPYFTGVSIDQNQSKLGFVLTLENEKAALVTSYPNTELKQVASQATGQYQVVGSVSSAEAPTPRWFIFSGLNDGSKDRDLNLPTIAKIGLVPGSANFVSAVSTPVGTTTYFGSTDVDSKGWTILKSTDGATFANADKFKDRYTKVSLGGIFSFQGRPIAFGGVQDFEKRSHWIIRYAEIDGHFQTLTTLDQESEEDLSAKAVGIATLGSNNQLAVIGRGHDSKTGYHWRLMRLMEHPFHKR